MGFDASALEGGFNAWKAKYSVEPVPTEQTVGQLS
jgi:rhodanese-related sulfurtransferase